MFLNYDQTIVGNLNKFLHNDNIDITIYNAAVSGKSLVGNINEFSVWFEKIPNFKPKIMIYYIGLNDRYVRKKKDGTTMRVDLIFFKICMRLCLKIVFCGNYLKEPNIFF